MASTLGGENKLSDTRKFMKTAKSIAKAGCDSFLSPPNHHTLSRCWQLVNIWPGKSEEDQ